MITPDDIITATAKAADVDRALIFSFARTRRAVVARRIACKLMRAGTTMSLPQIGVVMGLHHTTILHHIRTPLDPRGERLLTAARDLSIVLAAERGAKDREARLARAMGGPSPAEAGQRGPR